MVRIGTAWVFLVLGSTAVIGAPVPPVSANQAPPPRVVKPDASLIVIVELEGDGISFHTCVQRVDFRRGKVFYAGVIWEIDKRDVSSFAKGGIWANRYLVSTRGAVFDLHEKKLVNAERDGEVVRADDTRVTYWIAGASREQGLYTFEYATGKLTRRGELKESRIPPGVRRSPDNAQAINWVDGELFLHRDGQKPKSLGTGFKTDRMPGVLAGSGFSTFPKLWLSDNHFLTQRDTGKLVAVELDGKVAEVVTVKDLPKDGSLGLFRDRAGSIIYSVGDKNFKIDPENKTATPTDWAGLGHGFEMTWEPDADDFHTFRHNGKKLGRCECWPYEGVSAPGFLAVPLKNRREVTVWCAAADKWTTLEFTWITGTVAWIK